MTAITIWFTGLSASGKTTLAKKLSTLFSSFVWLDGDNFRKYVSNDLAFSEADREENLRRVIGVCRLLNEQGFSVIVSFISPLQRARDQVRNELRSLIIYLNTPLETCIKRDPKGLYKQAKAGKIKNFTGLDGIYEVPKRPDLTLNTSTKTVEESVLCIIRALNQKNLISSS